MDELKEIKDLISAQSQSLKRLETAILGDDPAGVKGLATQVKEHEVIINDYRANKNRLLGAKQILTIIGSAIVAFVTAVFASHK